jgi:hypothetical protein
MGVSESRQQVLVSVLHSPVGGLLRTPQTVTLNIVPGAGYTALNP